MFDNCILFAGYDVGNDKKNPGVQNLEERVFVIGLVVRRSIFHCVARPSFSVTSNSSFRTETAVSVFFTDCGSCIQCLCRLPDVQQRHSQ